MRNGQTRERKPLGLLRLALLGLVEGLLLTLLEGGLDGAATHLGEGNLDLTLVIGDDDGAVTDANKLAGDGKKAELGGCDACPLCGNCSKLAGKPDASCEKEDEI